MTKPVFYLCALEKTFWDQDDTGNAQTGVRSFVSDALGIERRIKKGVNQENERARYNLCCARIEAATASRLSTFKGSTDDFKAALVAGRVPVSSLEKDYLDVLTRMIQEDPTKSFEIRVGATFFPPETIATHCDLFQQHALQLGIADHVALKRRMAFFKLARQFNCGVVELQDAFQFTQESAPTTQAAKRSSSKTKALPNQDTPSPHIVDSDEAAFDNRGRELEEILKEQIQHALDAVMEGRKGTVNFSNQPHNVITEVLNDFVYAGSREMNGPIYINVIYTDGSQGEPFPLKCLPRRKDAERIALRRSPPLRVALMSMRHLEMDRQVDMAWFRNADISKSRTLAETDRVCYEQTRSQIEKMRSQGTLRLYLYQTGFQPAVIGFYRALVEELMYRKDLPASLEVIPYYFKPREDYVRGKSWY